MLETRFRCQVVNMAGWSGFTDEDLRKMKGNSEKGKIFQRFQWIKGKRIK